MLEMTTAIEIRNIDKSFDNNHILSQFSQNISENELVAVVGKSGCGKTTLLNILSGLEEPDSGEILIFGKKITNRNRQRFYQKTIGFLFQNFALVDNWTVEDNLKISLKFQPRMNKQERKQKIQEALDYVGLGDKVKSKIYSLSGGEQQRVALARLLLQNSKIILADEPTGSLDNENKELVFSILRDFQIQGKTVVIVTHDLTLANECDRIISLSELTMDA